MKNAIEENYWRNPYHRMHYDMVREIIPDDDKAKEIMKLFEPLVVDRINDYEEIRNLRLKALEGFSPTFYETAAGKPTHFSRGMKAAQTSILF